MRSPKRAKRNSRKPEIVVIEGAPEAPEITMPSPEDLAPQPLDQSAVKAQIKRLYPKADDGSQARIAEEVWSRLEFDTPYTRAATEKLGQHGNYTLLYEWTWPERFDVLERVHQVIERNPIAHVAAMWMRIFVVGNGGMLSYQSREAREIIEEFRSEPGNFVDQYEREFCDGLGADGELFIRFFKNEQGRVVITPIQPWHIFNIKKAENNYKKALSYNHITVGGGNQSSLDQQEIPADEILHVAINKYAYETRGRPDMFCELPWLKAFKDMLEERARVHRRKSIYYHVIVKNSAPGQVAAMQSKFLTPPPPGTIFVTNDLVEIKPVQANINAEQADADLRQMRLMAIAGTGQPEFFFSDSANGTLATATAQSVPVLKLFDDRQDILEGVWKHIYRYVLQQAIDAGRVEDEVDMIDDEGEPLGRTIKLVDSFDYQYPEIRERDVLNLAKALQIAEYMGWSSNSTNSAKMGFAPEVERLKIKLDKSRQPDPEKARGIGREKNDTPDGYNYAEKQ